jgi:hypothetical protein
VVFQAKVLLGPYGWTMPSVPPGGCTQNSYSGVPPQVALPVRVTVVPWLAEVGGLADSMPPAHGATSV